MPILHAQKISYTLDTGEILFNNLSLSIEQNISAIIGRNGAGKSVLASILAGEMQHDSGHVLRNFNHLGYFKQQEREVDTKQSIAQFMDVADILTAIAKVESGHYQADDLEAIGERWQAEDTLTNQLDKIAISLPLDTPYSQLSGGEKAKLSLLKLFNSKPDLLILDEPSNHLDAIGRQWLLGQLSATKAKVMLITHDKTLLQDVDTIYELSTLGLTQYLGNFQHYQTLKHTHLAAVERKLANAHRKQKQITHQKQLNAEKAQQRAASGNRLRKSASQAKVLLNTQRDSAEKSASSRKVQNQNLQTRSLETIEQLSKQKESLKPQVIYLQEDITAKAQKMQCELSIQSLQLPYTDITPLDLHIYSKDKLHLAGCNGSGKSTLMQIILGALPPKRGKIYRGAPLFYLDQHFGLIKPSLSLLEHLNEHCPNLTQTQKRTLLAGIGFRGQSVDKKTSCLSGGEKMKLCMLIAAHQTLLPLLLLDEPDNHLDIDSKHLLSKALKLYRGSFILISHDEEFIYGAGVTDTIELINRL